MVAVEVVWHNSKSGGLVGLVSEIQRCLIININLKENKQKIPDGAYR